MRSVRDDEGRAGTNPPSGRGVSVDADRTARARIRDAAILRFAVDGFGAPVRAIAKDAGVSPALVLHHFGSKDKLREECDEHVLGEIREAKQANVAELAAAEQGKRAPGSLLERMMRSDRHGPIVGYILRSLQGGGPLARAFVEHMVDDAAGYVRAGVEAGLIVPSRDEARRARYLTVSALGALLVELTLDPPEDPSDLGGVMQRYSDAISLPTFELYTEGFLTSRRMLDEYLMYVPDPPSQDEVAPAPG